MPPSLEKREGAVNLGAAEDYIYLHASSPQEILSRPKRAPQDDKIGGRIKCLKEGQYTFYSIRYTTFNPLPIIFND
ncbi:hypothetical protein DHB64_17800 [Antarcticibacterium sp. W02-3]|nr:hypothetical protein [Antarcticibacterium sp. W02-3]